MVTPSPMVAPVAIHSFTVTVCALCLDGAGGECHSPGCAFFICPAPDAEQAARLRYAFENDGDS